MIDTSFIKRIKLRPQQYQEPALLNLTSMYVGVMAGKRSGKSHLISVVKALFLAFVHPGYIGLVASPIYSMTRRNLLPLFRRVVDEWGIRDLLVDDALYTKAPDAIRIKVGQDSNGQPIVSTIWLDCTIENYERLNGLSLAWACVDEVDKARYEDTVAFIEELDIRCSLPAPGRTAQVNLTGAPEKNGFMAEFFIEKKDKDKVLYTWSMLQNDALSTEYKNRMLARIPESLQAGWIRGEPMYITDGLVYSCFNPETHNTNLTLDDYRPGDQVDVCWDINDGGTSVVFRIKRGKHTFYVDEWMKMKDTYAVLAKLSREKALGKPWAQNLVLSCDPASTQVHSYIFDAVRNNRGWKAAIMKSAPEIEWTITALNDLRFGLFDQVNGVKIPLACVNTKKCKVLTKCLTRQGYVKGVPDKKSPVAEAGTDISGPIDAMRYLEYRDFPWHPTKSAVRIELRGF